MNIFYNNSRFYGKFEDTINVIVNPSLENLHHSPLGWRTMSMAYAVSVLPKDNFKNYFGVGIGDATDSFFPGTVGRYYEKYFVSNKELIEQITQTQIFMLPSIWILLEFGTIGLCIWILWMVGLILKKNENNNHYVEYLTAISPIFLLSMFYGGFIFHETLGLFFIIILGLAIRNDKYLVENNS